MIITNGNLDVVDDGIEFVIKRDKSILDTYAPSFSFVCTFTLSQLNQLEAWMNGV